MSTDLLHDVIKVLGRKQDAKTLFNLAHVSRRTYALCDLLSNFNFWATSARIINSVISRRNCEVLAPAGFGKTTLLSRLYNMLTSDEWGMNVVVIAPTQAAAELLPAGETVHAFLHLTKTESLETLEKWYDAYCRNGTYVKIFGRGKNTAATSSSSRSGVPQQRAFPDLILCDEVSMIGSKMMENIDFILRHRRDCVNPDAMFGGAQMCFFGDFCQLPPVQDKRAFMWDKWADISMVRYQLTRPLRHDSDRAWFRYCQKVRQGSILYIRETDGGPITATPQVYEEWMQSSHPPLILSGINDNVDKMNSTEFARINAPIEVYEADDILVRYNRETKSYAVMHEAPDQSDRDIINKCHRCPQRLELKVGARYVITFNINKKMRIYNGQCCEYIGEQRMRLFSNDAIISLDRLYTTVMMRTRREDQTIYIKRTQMALRLGYAQTIHKSQGMTLHRAIVDCSQMRCPGMYYTAITRVRSRNDIRLLNPTKGQLSVSADVIRYVFTPVDYVYHPIHPAVASQ